MRRPQAMWCALSNWEHTVAGCSASLKSSRIEEAHSLWEDEKVIAGTSICSKENWKSRLLLTGNKKNVTPVKMPSTRPPTIGFWHWTGKRVRWRHPDGCCSWIENFRIWYEISLIDSVGSIPFIQETWVRTETWLTGRVASDHASFFFCRGRKR